MNKQIRNMAITGLGIAVVFIATMFIKIPNAIDGYFNLGDGCIVLFSSVLDPFSAFLVGGVGSAMADIAGGYAHYFIPTLVIKGVEAVFISCLMKKHSNKRLLIYIIASCWMVFGYFIVKWYLKGSMEVALLGIPENILQSGIGVAIGMLLYPLMFRLHKTTK